ncbi:SCAN domain-containing protein 3 [Danaus plexippus plexippus]|uniref:SCAN domain-containing protein 3 n=1 Tax=Danaus plexippus plexippus TaxID=278856 RepID=A0A212EMV5_DANPL|nr:SCAN domain-containing protein 3 [Danaus plexippus plexippus]
MPRIRVYLLNGATKMMKTSNDCSYILKLAGCRKVHAERDFTVFDSIRLSALHDDLKTRFEDMLTMDIPPWIINPFDESESAGRRRSGRRSINATTSSGASKERDPLVETTLLTTYTDFKDQINEKQISRSSMATRGQEVNIPVIVYQTSEDRDGTPKKTPLTPKIGKENIQHVMLSTPKNNLPYTPTRLTRSALKLNNDGFATPRAPLSANKVNLQRQNTLSTMSVKTTPNSVSRSKSHTHLVRVKNLPPLI